MRHIARYLFAAGAVATTSLQAACSSSAPEMPPVVAAPHGEPVDFATANEMVDEMAQAITTDLPRTTLAQNQEYKMVLAIGPIEVIGFDEPERFASALSSLQTRLMDSPELSRRFDMVTTTRADAGDILRETSGASADHVDPLGTNEDEVSIASYAPDDVIVLTGRFHQTAEGRDAKAVRLIVSIDHPRRRTRVMSREIRRTYVWDAETARWSRQAG